jgi:predicted RNase H-like HicB family nuclease
MEKLSRKYLVIYEQSADGYSAYVPDLPGCTSAGANREEIELNIIEAIKLHLEVMEEMGEAIPKPISDSQMLVFA